MAALAETEKDRGGGGGSGPRDARLRLARGRQEWGWGGYGSHAPPNYKAQPASRTPILWLAAGAGAALHPGGGRPLSLPLCLRLPFVLDLTDGRPGV